MIRLTVVPVLSWVLLGALAGCTSFQAGTESSSGMSVQTGASAPGSTPPPPSCTRDDNEVRGCLAQCDRQQRMSVSRCDRCRPGDASCDNTMCQMNEDRERQREDKECRQQCTEPPKRCR
jgi:hypothetical protein